MEKLHEKNQTNILQKRKRTGFLGKITLIFLILASKESQEIKYVSRTNKVNENLSALAGLISREKYSRNGHQYNLNKSKFQFSAEIVSDPLQKDKKTRRQDKNMPILELINLKFYFLKFISQKILKFSSMEPVRIYSVRKYLILSTQ